MLATTGADGVGEFTPLQRQKQKYSTY
jgi:hypothetical protein